MPAENQGVLYDISHYMTEDGPGIRTVFFVKGCPLKCKWCSNAYGLSFPPQLAVLRTKCSSCGQCVESCPQRAITISDVKGVVTDFSLCKACGLCVERCFYGARTIVGKRYTPDDVLEIAMRDADFYKRNHGGITFSGGEILAQTAFVADCLRLCRKRGLSTAIETSAYGSWKDLSLLLSLADVAFIDLKHMDPDSHKELTGVPNERILKNIRLADDYCREHGVCLVLRFPLIPGCNDRIDHFRRIGNFVKSLRGGPELNVLPYHEFGTGKYENIGLAYSLDGADPDLNEQIAVCKRIFQEVGIRFSIGGGNILSFQSFFGL